jgi:hypothetical protein
MFLPDVNLWLALAFDSHVHHPTALAWFQAAGQTCHFCRLSQQGFLRLATNPKVFNSEAVSLREAWAMYDAIQADPLVAYADEPKLIETYWRAYTRGESFTPKLWSDAYLAAFAQAAQLELVTFDAGFRRFNDAKCIILRA